MVVVEVALPSEIVDGVEGGAAVLPRHLQLLWLIEAVRTKKMGPNRAARLADMSLLDFYKELGLRGVAALELSESELEADLADLEDFLRAS
jgi:predicted HTH domain antitoxin